MNKYAVVILNWNGYIDTIELLKNYYDNEKNFDVYLLDNGSSDDSKIKILEFLKTSQYSFDVCNIDVFDVKDENNLHFVISNENHGFAIGNNLILKKINNKYEYYILLNNDTVIEKDSLTNLVNYAKEHNIDALSPKILNYYTKKIWYGGGRLTVYGDRKYYKDSKVNNIKKEYIKSSFITGCCLCLSQKTIDDVGFLSEDFFFGEEDFQYSYLLKRKHKKVGVLLTTIIYHKVSASSSKYPGKGTYVLHFTNRYVDKKMIYSKPKQFIWRLIYTPMLYARTLKIYKSFKQTNILMRNILNFAKKDNVKKDSFIEIVNTNYDN